MNQRRKDFPYYFKAGDKQFAAARKLRRDATPAEQFLWQVVRRKSVSGYKFRRQHPLGFYVADFYCHKAKLVVEVDGDIHLLEEVKRKDKYRDSTMKKYGLTVLRFSNEDVLFNVHLVVQEIEKFLT